MNSNIITITFQNEKARFAVQMTEDAVIEMIKNTPRLCCLLIDAKTEESSILGLNIYEALKLIPRRKMTVEQFLTDYLGWGGQFVNRDFLKNIPPEIETIIATLIDNIQPEITEP